jgi:hypothetical protein
MLKSFQFLRLGLVALLLTFAWGTLPSVEAASSTTAGIKAPPKAKKKKKKKKKKKHHRHHRVYYYGSPIRPGVTVNVNPFRAYHFGRRGYYYRYHYAYRFHYHFGPYFHTPTMPTQAKPAGKK